MNTQTIIELVGYIGSALVLVSFLMTSVFKLRIVNSVGSIIFMVYALIIHSYPTAIMNFCLVIINIHFLYKIMRTQHKYDLINLNRDDAYLVYLLRKQKGDIEKFFPTIDIEGIIRNEEVNRVYYITCHDAPAGITIGIKKDDALNLVLDYSFPEYRDFSIGNYLISNIKKEGINKLVYDGSTEHHMKYLNKMGFKPVGGIFIKEL